MNIIRNIDCVKGISKLQDGGVDCIITDPPYGLNKDGIDNDNDLSLFYKILPECYRVLKKDSFFITFFSTKYLPKVFINNPFNYFWHVVLYSPNSAVRSPIGFSKFMSCFIFKKGNPKLPKRRKDIFLDSPGRKVEPDEGYINHPTPKPKSFIKELLEMFTKEGDLVLDPFIGSGSTALACKLSNRKYIGFEKNEKYYNLALKRLNKKK